MLIQVFRRARKRVTRSEKVRNTIEKLIKQKQNSGLKNDEIKIKKLNKQLTFPWWSKILAYIFSLVCCAVSIFFILVKGITFGDEKSAKWLTSFLVSILSSALLTQPLQVSIINKSNKKSI